MPKTHLDEASTAIFTSHADVSDERRPARLA